MGIKIRSVGIVLLLILAYSPILLPANLVNPDAQYIFPTLINIHSFSDYFHQVLNLKTMDIQPVRDLGFILDLKVFEAFQVNITIIHNLLIWMLIGWVINRILKNLFQSISTSERILIVGIFLLYPLFTQTVSWGVARKHLLAFLFVLFATDHLISVKSKFNFKDSAIINAFYFLAIFSQPITMLWPVWAFLYVLLTNKENVKSFIKVLIPAGLLFLVCFFMNQFYYAHSPVYFSIYASEPKNVFDFGDHVLSLGHYVFQIFFPYLLSTFYTLGHWGTLAGLGVLGLFSLFVMKSKINHSQTISWILFALIPLAFVTLRSPTLWDTYLLMPTFGIFIVLLMMKESSPDFRFKNFVYCVFIVVFVFFDFNETSKWKSDIELTKSSFERRPNCLTASHFLRISYEQDQPPTSDEAKKFIFQNDCGKYQLKGKSLVNLQSYLLFYEQDLPETQRIEKLEKLSELGILPKIVLIAYFLKLNQTDKADENIKSLIENYGHTNFRPEYIPLVTKYLEPYCRKQTNQECLRLVNVFTRPAKSLFYK